MIHRTLVLTAALAWAAACDAHTRSARASPLPRLSPSSRCKPASIAPSSLFRRPEGIRDSLSGQVWPPDDRFVHWPGVGPNRGTFEIVDPKARTVAPLLARAELSAQLAGGRCPRHYLQSALARTIRGSCSGSPIKTFALGLDDRRVVALAAGRRARHLLAPDTVLAPDRRALLVRRGHGFAVLAADGRVVVDRDGEPDAAWKIPREPHGHPTAATSRCGTATPGPCTRSRSSTTPPRSRR